MLIEVVNLSKEGLVVGEEFVVSGLKLLEIDQILSQKFNVSEGLGEAGILSGKLLFHIEDLGFELRHLADHVLLLFELSVKGIIFLLKIKIINSELLDLSVETHLGLLLEAALSVVTGVLGGGGTLMGRLGVSVS